MYRNSPTLVGLTQGQYQPSTRFRWSQYINDFRESGFEVSHLESHFGGYAPDSRLKRLPWITGAMAENAVRTVLANRYDLRFIQRNLIATLCTLEPLLKKPFVFDVDDAIFLESRGISADRIAQKSSLVICGNNFLANHFEKFAPVIVLPTAVDTLRFKPPEESAAHQQIIGWSGSSSGFKYLYLIEPAINEILIRFPEAILKVVSDRKPEFNALPESRVIFEKWTAEREVEILHEFTVGIMPLEDNLWAKGKCSFKMLTYMAAGLPVVVSPVGMNKEVLMQADCGLAATTLDEWVYSITQLFLNPSHAEKMGLIGRKLIEERYARNVIAPQLCYHLKNLL